MKKLWQAIALGLVVCVSLILVNTAWQYAAETPRSSPDTLTGDPPTQVSSSSPTVNPTVDVPMWSVHEIELQSTQRYANPYTQIDVTATFQGPNDSKQTVQGFWNGDRTFIVRFTPTVSGKWHYTTSSRDSGLNAQTGTINCTDAKQSDRGFLRRDADHRYSFVWDDGSRYFMFGQTYYDLMKLAMVKPDWKTSVDNSRAMGMNKIRFFLPPQPQSRPKSPDPPTSPYGSNKDTLNLAHWQKLDEVIQYMKDRETVAELLLFNYRDIYGTQTQDERYLKYAIARYAAFPNVIWCLANEWNYTPKSQSYWNTLGEIVRRQDPWFSREKFLRPLSIHQQTRIDFQFFERDWPVHAIIQFGVRNKKYAAGDEWGNEGIRYNLGQDMPVVNDEYGYVGEYQDKSVKGAPTLTRTKHRQIMWGIYTAGGYASAGDKYKYSQGRPYFSGYWYQPDEYADIKQLVNFFTTKGIEYWQMSSQNSLIKAGTRVYALANPGKQYVFYAAVGGKFTAQIAPGTYTVRRYNPRTGEDVALANVTGNDLRSFALPDQEDWVVYLKVEDSKAALVASASSHREEKS